MRKGVIAAVVAAVGGGAAVGGYLIRGPSGVTVPPAASEPSRTTTQTITVTPTATPTTVPPGTGPETGYSVPGATPAERAINGIKRLRELGKIPSGARIKFLEWASFKANVAPEAGSERRDARGLIQKATNLLELWEAQTGIPVDMDLLAIDQLYQIAIDEAATQAGTWDVFTQRLDFLHDLIAADAIVDATAPEATYGGEMETGTCPAFPAVARAHRSADGRLWATPTCADYQNLYVRHDLVTNLQYQREFESEFGYVMPIGDVPTWEQVFDLAKFFDHRESDADGNAGGLRGCYFPRDPIFCQPEFYIRFLELGGLYLDAQGNVTLDVPNQFGVNALRKALEDMKKLAPYQSSEVLTGGQRTSWLEFAAKKVFCALALPVLAQIAAAGPVGPQGIGVYHVPGYVTGTTLVRVSALHSQLAHMIAKWGKLTRQIPDVPYLFSQFLSDPEVSVLYLANPGAIEGPYRTCHTRNESLIRTFAAYYPPHPDNEPGRRGAMETYDITLPLTVPPMALIGQKEIAELQGQEMHAYFRDLQDLGTTARNIQAGVQAVVDRVGRDKELVLWKYLVDSFPSPLKRLHGIESAA